MNFVSCSVRDKHRRCSGVFDNPKVEKEESFTVRTTEAGRIILDPEVCNTSDHIATCLLPLGASQWSPPSSWRKQTCISLKYYQVYFIGPIYRS